DLQMRAFLAFAGTTTMRKGEILSLRWQNIHLGEPPSVKLVRTKTGHQRQVPLPAAVVDALQLLPSRGTSEYVFPSRSTAPCPEAGRAPPRDWGDAVRGVA